MKKLSFFLMSLLLGIAVFCMAPSGEAAGMNPGEQAKAVQALEDALLTIPGDGDTLDTRVSRLEQTVFGQPQKGSTLESRIVRLQKVMTTTRQASQPQTSTPATGAMKNGMPSGPVSSTGPPASTPYAGPLPGHPQRPTSAPASVGASPVYPQTYPIGGYPQAASSIPPARTEASPAPDETDYPTVGQMEQQIFGRTYVKEDITLRLARLEKHVFKLVQTGSLADRVDNLRLVVLGDVAPSGAASAAAAGPASPNGSPYYTPSPYPPSNPAGSPNMPASSTYAPPGGYSGGGGYGYSPQTQQAYGRPPYYAPPGYAPSGYVPGGGNAPGPIASTTSGGGTTTAIPSDLPAAIAQVEKDVLGKTFPEEAVNARLDRLETKVFHATSPELSSEDRMQRIIAVASAGGAPESGKAKAKHTIQSLLPIILTILPMVLL